jgi:hypothetical protein
MNPSVKYTLGRLGLFAVLFVVLLPVPWIGSVLVKAMIALLVSAIASLFLLRQWRDEMAEQLTASAERRKAQRDKLRAALAGDDAQPSATGAAATAAERAAASALDATRNRDEDERKA